MYQVYPPLGIYMVYTWYIPTIYLVGVPDVFATPDHSSYTHWQADTYVYILTHTRTYWYILVHTRAYYHTTPCTWNQAGAALQ